MKNTQNAESFAGIIVGVFILSFVILAIANIITYSRGLSQTYSESNRLLTLEENINNIAKKLDTSMLGENEVFYIHKNTSSAEYEIIRPEECIASGGSQDTCHAYAFINIWGEKIDNLSSYEGDIYSHKLWVSYKDTTLLNNHQVIQKHVEKVAKN